MRPSRNISFEPRGNVSIPLLAVAARDAFASKKTATAGLEGWHFLKGLEGFFVPRAEFHADESHEIQWTNFASDPKDPITHCDALRWDGMRCDEIF